MTFAAIASLHCTCHFLHVIADEELHHVHARFLTQYVHDVEGFKMMLRHSHAVISGSTALLFIDHFADWFQPLPFVDLYCPNDSFDYVC